jgi:hypothetical protein
MVEHTTAGDSGTKRTAQSTSYVGAASPPGEVITREYI